VFLDENGNATPDSGEPVSVTDSSGNFQFTSLSAGSYSVSLAPGADVQTGNVPSVTIVAGQSISGLKIAAVPAPVTGGPDLSASAQIQPTSAVIGGAKGKLKLVISNSGPGTVSGPVQIALFASNDGTLHPSDSPFATIASTPLKLKSGASKSLQIPFTFPSGLPDGNYFILASVDSTNAIAESDEANNIAVAPQAVTIRLPFVDLTGTFAHGPGSLKAGNPFSIPLTIQNAGNSAASGTIQVDLFASADQVLDASDQALVTHVALSINIKPRKTKVATLHIPRGATVTGNVFLIAKINSMQSLVESSYANDNALSEAAISIA
jgi:uncharacterized protein (DUF2141 family)